MTIRTRRRILEFAAPFSLRSAAQVVPAGSYEVVTDEELVEGLSFPVYRRIATYILVPGLAANASTIEMLPVEPAELEIVRTRGSGAASAT
jgi:hypothetical protein